MFNGIWLNTTQSRWQGRMGWGSNPVPTARAKRSKIQHLKIFQEIEKLEKELELVRSTCKKLKEETDLRQENFETEKASWLDEKEKVIRYQKQLQLNYVQVWNESVTNGQRSKA